MTKQPYARIGAFLLILASVVEADARPVPPRRSGGTAPARPTGGTSRPANSAPPVRATPAYCPPGQRLSWKVRVFATVRVPGNGSACASMPSAPPRPPQPSPPGTRPLVMDAYSFSATGMIGSNVVGSGRNGPDGWRPPLAGEGFPVAGQPRYGLIYRLGNGGWSFAGTSTVFRRPLNARTPQTVCFMVNDDKTHDNDGAFEVTITRDEQVCEPVPPVTFRTPVVVAPAPTSSSSPPPCVSGTTCKVSPKECQDPNYKVDGTCVNGACQAKPGTNYCTAGFCTTNACDFHAQCAPNQFCNTDPSGHRCENFKGASCTTPWCWLREQQGTVINGCKPSNPQVVCGDGSVFSGLEECDPPGQRGQCSVGKTCGSDCKCK